MSNRERTSVKSERKQTREKKTEHHEHQRLSKISFIVLIISRHCATENVASAATNHTVRVLIPAVGHAPLLPLSTQKSLLTFMYKYIQFVDDRCWAVCGCRRGGVSPWACVSWFEKIILHGETSGRGQSQWNTC